MQGIPIVEESSISVKQMEPQQIPTELSKLVIRRQQVLDLYVQKQQELSLLSKECGRLATAIFQAADKEEFIIQNGDELILIKLDPEEGCILVQKRVPLIKEQ
ncbi:hypothetical protein [Cylindrospermum stagnale]|nr:hypothetical protein [Cylindrospermum stagnale]